MRVAKASNTTMSLIFYATCPIQLYQIGVDGSLEKLRKIVCPACATTKTNGALHVTAIVFVAEKGVSSNNE